MEPEARTREARTCQPHRAWPWLFGLALTMLVLFLKIQLAVSVYRSVNFTESPDFRLARNRRVPEAWDPCRQGLGVLG